MLDTGAQPSLIKKGCLNINAQISRQETIQLTGITKNIVNTLGTVVVNISHAPVTFHVVNDEFPIVTQGILGSSFFSEHQALIDYPNQRVILQDIIYLFKDKESIVLPARTNMGVIARVLNPEIGTGYLRRLDGCEGVIAGDALVTCINDKAFIRVINTLNHEIEITVPNITLTEVEEISTSPPYQSTNSKLSRTATKNYLPEAPERKINYEKLFQINREPTNSTEENVYLTLPLDKHIANTHVLTRSSAYGDSVDPREITSPPYDALRCAVHSDPREHKPPFPKTNSNSVLTPFNAQASVCGDPTDLREITSPLYDASRCVVDSDSCASPSPINSAVVTKAVAIYTRTDDEAKSNSTTNSAQNFTSNWGANAPPVDEEALPAPVRPPLRGDPQEGRPLSFLFFCKGSNAPPADDTRGDSLVRPLADPCGHSFINSNPSSSLTFMPLNTRQPTTRKNNKQKAQVNTTLTKNSNEYSLTQLRLRTHFNATEEHSSSKRISEIFPLLRLDHLNEIERENIGRLILRYSDRFYIPGEYLSHTSVITHKIQTTDSAPIHTKQYRFPPVHRDEIFRQVKDLANKDIVVPSVSPYNSPVWVVPKKPDSSGNKRWRMVIDFRRLNEKTVGDAYPLPNICDILDQLGGAKYFSVLDLASGFHQIPMESNDAHKTAFSTPHGHYEYSRMPFGLRNAPATFQRLMDQILTGLQGIEMFVYMDDIVIYACSLREHDIKIDKLMKRLQSANLMLQPDKCEFLRHEVAYLGHIISENGVRPDPQKIAAVKNFPTPRNLKNVRQFLGLAGYYRRFIPEFSKIANPLSSLLKKGASFKWNQKAQEGFNTLRELLCKEPILQFPDPQKEFLLTTDASDYAIGGVLSQGTIGQDLPVAYASRVLNSAERNYATIEKELLAIVYCTNHFRPYLYGRHFTLVTDHQPLTWLHRVKDPTSRLMRWRLKLEEYNYSVIYKPGSINKNADALSRNPIESITHFSVYPIRKRVLSENSTDEDNHPDEPPAKLPKSSKYHDHRGISPPPDLNTPTSIGRELLETPLQKFNTTESDEELFTFPRRDASRTALPRSSPIPSNLESPISNLASDRYLPETGEIPFDPGGPAAPSSPEGTLDADDDQRSIASTTENLLPETEPTVARGVNCHVKEDCKPLLERNDNIVIMVSTDRHPFDEGAIELHRAGKLPPLDSLTLGRARVYPSAYADRHIIVLPVKECRTTPVDKDILKECLISLLDVMTELDLSSISLRKTKKLDSLSWNHVQNLLRTMVDERSGIITVCHGDITTPTPEERTAIIKEHHESMIGGHKGITKTYRRIKQRFWWNNMKNDVQEYIRQCRICQTTKLVRRKTRQPMILTDTPGKAFDKIALDIMGPLATTARGNSYILTMQDLLTKYSIYAPLPDATAETIAEAFISYFICRFGCPKSILTDQGQNFVGNLIKVITKKFRIQHFRTTAYHPQSNGSLERSHHVLLEYLKCFISKEEYWDDIIERATFSYNTAVHEGTGYTPHELIFGTIARIPSSYNQESDPETYYSCLTNLFNQIRDLQESARINLVKAKERSKTYYDKRIYSGTFKLNDNVFMTNEQKTGKFSNEYLGPYQIVEVMDKENVKIRIKNSTKIVHANRLRKAYYEPG